MKGIGLFVSSKLGKKFLFSTDYSASSHDFFGLAVEGAIELFLSKRPCIENSILDLTLDNTRYLSLPSTLNIPFHSFTNEESFNLSPDIRLLKFHSEELGAKSCKHKAKLTISRHSTAPLNISFGQQEDYTKNVEIKLFTIVFVVNTSLVTMDQLEKYVQLLKGICNSFM